MPTTGKLSWLALVGALIASFFLLQSFNRANAPQFDEGIHIAAGLRADQCHNYGINPEHPPLAKAFATWPARHWDFGQLLANCETTVDSKVQGFALGYLVIDSPNGDRLIHRARLQLIVFPLALIVLVFLAVRHWFSPLAAMIAVSLLAFEPLITAHASLIGTDMPEAFAMFAALAAALYFTDRPTVVRGVLLAASFSLAVTVKHSGPFIIPIALIAMLLARRFGAAASYPRIFFAWSVSSLASYIALWATYSFRFYAVPGIHAPVYGFNPGPIAFLARHHLFPEAYLFGLADILHDSDILFLFGHFHPTGVWYYFPAVMAIKTTLPLLALIALAIVFLPRLWRQNRSATAAALLITLAYLAIAMRSRVDIGVRHVLPIYPFLIVLAAAAAAEFIRLRRSAAVIVAALLVWQAAAITANSPYQLAYANEAAGGRNALYHYINIDGGESAYLVRDWAARNAATPCFVAWESPTPLHTHCPQIAGMALDLFDVEPVAVPAQFDGDLLISDAILNNDQLPFYSFLHGRRPDAIFAGTILLYRGPHDLRMLATHQHLLRAAWLLRHGRPAEAATECAAADPAYAPHARLALLYGVALLQSGQPDQARAQLKQAVQLSEHDPAQANIYVFARRELDRLPVAK